LWTTKPVTDGLWYGFTVCPGTWKLISNEGSEIIRNGCKGYNLKVLDKTIVLKFSKSN
jgi:hypothetical protein